MRAQSAKRRREQAIRRAIVDELGDQPCRIRAFNVCTGQAEALHELVGSAQGGSRIDRRNIVPACNRCNVHVEDQPKLAVLSGWKVPRRDSTPGDRGLVPAVPSPLSVAAIQGRRTPDSTP